MNKFYKVILGIFLLAMVQISYGQAKKLIMFEHFTQASCAPCAAQNPAFEAIYEVNKHNVNHVAYHTSWPGVDEMNAANKPEVQSMVDLYAVNGVPDMEADGVNLGSPTNVSQALIDQAGSSPIRILVEDTNAGAGVHNVKVTVETLGNVPSGDYIIRSLVAEELVTYATPPGTNGEKLFPNVFRKFISTNGATGDVYVPAAIGSTVEYNYSYTVDAKWVEAQVYPIAYVQNIATKSILQSGTSKDEKVEAVNTETAVFQKGNKVDGNQFSFALNNLSKDPVTLKISLNGTWPSDWSGSVEIDGKQYADGDEIIVDAFANVAGKLNVSVGNLPGIGEFYAGVYNASNDTKQSFSYTVISGITDLLVVSDNLPAAGTPDLKAPYFEGLTLSGEPAFAALGGLKTQKGFEANVLDEIQHIYYSVGWTFPAMTNEFAGYIMNFMDNGGNFMICGQDVNWDMASGDANANGNAATKQLVNEYLSADFIADGDATSTQIKSVTGDLVFDGLSASGINKTYGTTYYYPDQIAPLAPDGYTIFTYNTAAKVAGVRAHHPTFKTVDIGIGLEMVALPGLAQEITKRTHDWFHGIITGTEFDNYIQNLAMSQNYPNPADQYTTISLGNVAQNNLTLTVVDLNGRTVLKQEIAKGAKSEKVITSYLTDGIYQYFLTDGKTFNSAKKLVVMH